MNGRFTARWFAVLVLLALLLPVPSPAADDADREILYWIRTTAGTNPADRRWAWTWCRCMPMSRPPAARS